MSENESGLSDVYDSDDEFGPVVPSRPGSSSNSLVKVGSPAQKALVKASEPNPNTIQQNPDQNETIPNDSTIKPEPQTELQQGTEFDPKPETAAEELLQPRHTSHRANGFTLQEDHYLLALVFASAQQKEIPAVSSSTFFKSLERPYLDFTGVRRTGESLRARYRRDLRATAKSFYENDSENKYVSNYTRIFEKYRHIVETSPLEGNQVAEKQKYQRRTYPREWKLLDRQVDEIISNVENSLPQKVGARDGRAQTASKREQSEREDAEFLDAEPRGKRQAVSVSPKPDLSLDFDRYVKSDQKRLDQLLSKDNSNSYLFDNNDCIFGYTKQGAGDSLESGTYILYNDELKQISGSNWSITLPTPQVSKN